MKASTIIIVLIFLLVSVSAVFASGRQQQQLTLSAGHSPIAKTAKVFSQLHYLQSIIAKHCLTEQNH
jgi:hypothetical protein